MHIWKRQEMHSFQNYMISVMQRGSDYRDGFAPLVTHPMVALNLLPTSSGAQRPTQSLLPRKVLR